jgi:ABC-2 type transport system permease protein
MPLLLMTALRPLYVAHEGVAAGTTHATAGAMVLFSLITLNVVGHNLLNERTWRTWDRLRATPATALELHLGKAIPFYGMLLAQQAVLLVYSAVFFGLRVHGPVPAMVGIMLAWPAAVLGIALLLAGLVRSHGQLNTINDIGAFAVTVIGGGLTPLSALPAWIQSIAPFSPGYWAVLGYRNAFTGNDADTTLPPVAVVLLVAAATAIAAFSLAARRSGVSHQP